MSAVAIIITGERYAASQPVKWNSLKCLRQTNISYISDKFFTVVKAIQLQIPVTSAMASETSCLFLAAKNR